MSRTFKDRPFWVKSNDPSLRRSASHGHLRFGIPIYRRVPVKDENGNFVYNEYLGYRLIERENAALKLGITDLYRVIDKPEFGFLFRKEPHIYTDGIKYERVIVGYHPDHCTIAEPATSSSDISFGCHYWFDINYSADMPKFYRQQHHVKQRRAKRDSLVKYVKEFNSNGLDDDFSYASDSSHDPRIKRGWWS